MQNITLGTTGGATNNRIATVNGVSYAYDAAGDVTSDGAHTYQYDCEGRIAKVDAGSANEADYFYDLNNWRVKKVTGVGGASPVTTYYVWDAGRVISEYSTAAPTGNGVRYCHPDRLSTRMITDPSGNVIGTEDVLPFGEDAGTGSGVTEKHRFTTYERDLETATDYGMNRQHATNAGRFMQPDFIPGSTDLPQSFNRYSYALNDPVNLYDPLGLCVCYNRVAEDDQGNLLKWVECWGSDCGGGGGGGGGNNGSGGGGGTGGGAAQTSSPATNKNGVACPQKILDRFNARFGLNVPLANTRDLGARGVGHVTDNIQIFFPFGTLPADLVHAGRFGGGTLGTGSTLHIVSFFVGVDPNNQPADIVQVHLDQGNPLKVPFGSFSHLGYVLTHGAGPCP